MSPRSLFWCLLLATAINSSDAVRHLQSSSSVGVRLHRLPCTDTGCQQGTEKRFWGFSALHDFKIREVTVYFDAAFDDQDPGELALECVFWGPDFANTAPVTLPSKGFRVFDDKVEKAGFAPYVARCPDPTIQMQEKPSWVALVVEGTDTKIRLAVEQVDLTQRGAVGVCLAPLYNLKPVMFYEWLSHYTRLGVEGFQIYWTNQTVQWSSESQLELDPTIVKPFTHPLVSWIQYDHLPLEERFYFNQQTAYNDCVARNRHRYKYLLMFDMDEFLIVRDERFQQQGSLQGLLDHIFPPLRAALGVYRYAYRDDCQEEESATASTAGAYQKMFTHRVRESESKSVLGSRRSADKLVIRPEGVDIFYMHFLASAREGYVRETLNAQPAITYLKHLRNYGHSCEELTEEDPFDQD